MADLHAALKAAAWALVAALGPQKALEAIEALTAEIRNAQWNGR